MRRCFIFGVGTIAVLCSALAGSAALADAAPAITLAIGSSRVPLVDFLKTTGSPQFIPESQLNAWIKSGAIKPAQKATGGAMQIREVHGAIVIETTTALPSNAPVAAVLSLPQATTDPVQRVPITYSREVITDASPGIALCAGGPESPKLTQASTRISISGSAQP